MNEVIVRAQGAARATIVETDDVDQLIKEVSDFNKEYVGAYGYGVDPVGRLESIERRYSGESVDGRLLRTGYGESYPGRLCEGACAICDQAPRDHEKMMYDVMLYLDCYGSVAVFDYKAQEKRKLELQIAREANASSQAAGLRQFTPVPAIGFIPITEPVFNMTYNGMPTTYTLTTTFTASDTFDHLSVDESVLVDA